MLATLLVSSFLSEVIATSAAAEFTLAAYGDSLMAGYGLPAEQGFMSLLEKSMRSNGDAVRVLNHAVSGNTTADALNRISLVLNAAPDGVLICLGGNDSLRAIHPKTVEKNLNLILSRFSERGIPVLLAGMEAPTNWGLIYKFSFDGIFERVADRHGAMFYPFFLKGVALKGEFNLADGVHPNARGVAEIVLRLTPVLQAFIRKNR